MFAGGCPGLCWGVLGLLFLPCSPRHHMQPLEDGGALLKRCYKPGYTSSQHKRYAWSCVKPVLSFYPSMFSGQNPVPVVLVEVDGAQWLVERQYQHHAADPTRKKSKATRKAKTRSKAQRGASNVKRKGNPNGRIKPQAKSTAKTHSKHKKARKTRKRKGKKPASSGRLLKKLKDAANKMKAAGGVGKSALKKSGGPAPSAVPHDGTDPFAVWNFKLDPFAMSDPFAMTKAEIKTVPAWKTAEDAVKKMAGSHNTTRNMTVLVQHAAASAQREEDRKKRALKDHRKAQDMKKRKLNEEFPCKPGFKCPWPNGKCCMGGTHCCSYLCVNDHPLRCVPNVSCLWDTCVRPVTCLTLRILRILSNAVADVFAALDSRSWPRSKQHSNSCLTRPSGESISTTSSASKSSTESTTWPRSGG